MTESEWLTRKKRVDPMLQMSGWKIIPFDAAKSLEDYHCCAVTEFETKNGPADYALIANGRILGIVEAKKLTLGPQNVLTQAERYSKGATVNLVQYRGFYVPFLYSTNGEVIWHYDVRHPLNRSRQITSFHSPEALEERIGFDLDSALDKAKIQAMNAQLRPYQVKAIRQTEEAIATRKRVMLVAQATGCGKTYQTVNLLLRQLNRATTQHKRPCDVRSNP